MESQIQESNLGRCFSSFIVRYREVISIVLLIPHSSVVSLNAVIITLIYINHTSFSVEQEKVLAASILWIKMVLQGAQL